MQEKKNKKNYKTNYYGTDNSDITMTTNIKDEIIAITKEMNPATEKMEYKETIINHKKDWENTIQNLKANELMKESKE